MKQSRLHSRVGYFVRSALNRVRAIGIRCPECSSHQSVLIRRKYVVTELRRCLDCELLYRAPSDPPDFASRFYQSEYRSGATTDCPRENELVRLKQTQFKHSAKDFAERIAILKALGALPGATTILDFGCSWGYGTWQIKEAGFDVIGTEISESRAQYARENLGLEVISSPSRLKTPVDVFFSSHVIEHLSKPSTAVEDARRLLKPGGLFVAFTPNGCQERMDHDPKSYHSSWGGVHPSYLDDRYWLRSFPDCSCLVASNPYSIAKIENWNQRERTSLSLRGSELLLVARLPD